MRHKLKGNLSLFFNLDTIFQCFCVWLVGTTISEINPVLSRSATTSSHETNFIIISEVSNNMDNMERNLQRMFLYSQKQQTRSSERWKRKIQALSLDVHWWCAVAGGTTLQPVSRLPATALLLKTGSVSKVVDLIIHLHSKNMAKQRPGWKILKLSFKYVKYVMYVILQTWRCICGIMNVM